MRLDCSWMGQIFRLFCKVGKHLLLSKCLVFFPVSIDLWKISCRMGANSLCNVKEQWVKFVRTCSLVWAQSFKQLVNAFSSYAYVRHFLDGGRAGMGGWHQSHANLAMTSVLGSYNYGGFGAEH